MTHTIISVTHCCRAVFKIVQDGELRLRLHLPLHSLRSRYAYSVAFIPQSDIEETLARISVMGGVEGYVITDGKGTILRQSKGMSSEQAAKYSTELLALTNKARHVVRDIDPKVRTLRRVCASTSACPSHLPLVPAE